MKMVEFSIRRGVSTTMLYALVILLGVVAIPKIPLEFMPKMDMPFVEIHVPYEGASPVEVCEKIAEPIEEAIATLPGIKDMRTRCRAGYAYIGIDLSERAKMDYAVIDVQERIDSIRSTLPADMKNLFIAKFDTEQFPVVMGAITFPNDQPENNELLDRLVIRPLKTVDGVAEVNLEGLEQKRVLVEIDQNRLTNMGVSVLQVFSALTSSNLTISAGEVDFAGKRHSVRLLGELRDLDEIRRLPVSKTVRIGDVADVRYDFVKPFFIGRLNKHRAYIVMVLKESGANTVATCRRIDDRIAELLKNPRLSGVQFKIWFNQSTEITSSIDTLTESGWQGALLAFLVLVLFLKNFRSTAIISISIPVSIIVTIACMYFMKVSFNVITLSAMIVSVGMLVDNSIVVLEAIDLQRRRGVPVNVAAVEGANEVGLAISASTTTTIIVFLPLIFTKNTTASILMKQLGLVLSLSIVASLVVSLTLIPLLSSRLLKDQPGKFPRWYVLMAAGFIGLLKLGLRRRLLTLGVIAFLFLGSVQLFFWPLPWTGLIEKRGYTGVPLIEKEAVPAALMKIVNIGVKFDKKPPLEEIDQKMTVLEDLFLAKKEEWDLDTVATIVSPVFNRVMLVLPNDRNTKYTAAQLTDMATAYLAQNINWPGVTFDTSGEGMGGGPHQMGLATSIKVRGPNPEQVYDFAEMIRSRLIGLPGLKEIKPIERTGEEEFHVMVDRDLARAFGFDLSQVAMAVSYSIRGVPVGQLLGKDSPLDIFIQVAEADRQTMAQVEEMNIQNLRGEFIPLGNVARFKRVPIPEMVRRDNRLITARIPIVPEGHDLSVVANNVRVRLQGLRLPMGYSWVVGEEFEEAKEDLKTLAEAIGLAMILVFLIMTAQFESIFLPFVIMFTIPFAMIGVVISLILGHATFNVLSGAGCLLLVGIVVNNAIVLVDHIHNLRKKGVSDYDSLVQAAEDRLRPIMMTALTTCLGLVPMAIGLNDTGRMMYSPLAISVLGGMAVATFFTPFVIPLIYSFVDDLMRWLRTVWAVVKEV